MRLFLRLQVVVLLSLLGGAAIQGCGSPTRPLPEQTSAVLEALDQAQSFTVSVTLPANVSLSQTLVGASAGLSAGDRANVGGLLATTQNKATVGLDAKVSAVTAGGDVELKDRSQVSGNVLAGGNIVRSPSAVVNGTAQSHVAVGSNTFSWTVTAPAVSSGDVSLEPDVVRDLAPGTYGNLTVKSRAKLTLHSGIYVFSSVQIEPQATLAIDSRNAPVQLYAKTAFTFRGAVATASLGIPQLLVGYLGSGSVFIESPFVGVFAAPAADVQLQAATPNGHRGSFFGRTVTLQPDIIIQPLVFDWVSVGGPGFAPPPPANPPIHDMPKSPADMPISVRTDGTNSGPSTRNTPVPVIFNLPTSYPVAGGEICNSTVTFRFSQSLGPLVTCTYQGGASTNQPATADELNKGRTLNFVSCSDGLPPTAQRRATHFELAVAPCPGFPVSVTAPVVNDGACSENLELLSVSQTKQMHDSFNWQTAQKVPATNPDGTHTLYYAWLFVRNKDELLAIRKLAIHLLKHPLFTEELDLFSGKCGMISNPGDGTGTFVPVLIPGQTYNALIDAIHSNNIKGDKVLFDAVVLRTPPATARNANNSVRLDVLAQAGFHYLNYDPNPFQPIADMQLDGGASRVLLDVVTTVGETARNVGQFVTNELGNLDKFIRGHVHFTFNLNVLNTDANFPAGTLMTRGWGPFVTQRMGAPGMEISILQKLFDLPIPTTSQGDTDAFGKVSIDAVQNGDPRGSGLCIEMANDTAVETDFLLADEMCDFRGFDPTKPTPGNFQLRDFSTSPLNPIDVHIDNGRLRGFYEAVDVAAWAFTNVSGFFAKRARILTGYWASTLSPDNNDGTKRLTTICMNYPNSASDIALGVAFVAGGIFERATPDPGFSTLILPVIALALGNTDIIMSDQSVVSQLGDREAMSHEMGHYETCSLLESENPFAVDHLVWSSVRAALNSKTADLREPLRYINEAMAEFFDGQVTGGADYGWLPVLPAPAPPETRGSFCIPPPPLKPGDPPTPPWCWDANGRAHAAGPDNKEDIARIASLVQDVFDGHQTLGSGPAPSGVQLHSNTSAAFRFGAEPGDGDVWTPDPAAPDPSTAPLVLSLKSYNDTDFLKERVSLDGNSLHAIARGLAFDLEPFGTGTEIDDPKMFHTLNFTMIESGVNWCERCRVFALHSTQSDPQNVRSMFQTCVSDPLIAVALGGPPPGSPPLSPADAVLQLSADTCAPCGSSVFTDENGSCGAIVIVP